MGCETIPAYKAGVQGADIAYKAAVRRAGITVVRTTALHAVDTYNHNIELHLRTVKLTGTPAGKRERIGRHPLRHTWHRAIAFRLQSAKHILRPVEKVGSPVSLQASVPRGRESSGTSTPRHGSTASRG